MSEQTDSPTAAQNLRVQLGAVIGRKPQEHWMYDGYDCPKAAYTCARCGKVTGRIGKWLHTYLEWAWWRPFDKRPYDVRNRCVRWLPW